MPALDVGSNEVEGMQSLVKRGQEAFLYLTREQLILAPDCGMLLLSRKAARSKLANVAAAARKLNDQFGVGVSHHQLP